MVFRLEKGPHVDFMLLFINFVKGANSIHKTTLWPQTSDMNNKACKVFLNHCAKKSTVIGNKTMTERVVFPLRKKTSTLQSARSDWLE